MKAGQNQITTQSDVMRTLKRAIKKIGKNSPSAEIKEGSLSPNNYDEFIGALNKKKGNL